MGQSTEQAGAHYRKRAGQAQTRADRLAAQGNDVGAALYLAERDQWVALADEIDAYFRGDLYSEVVKPTSEDVAMF